MTDLPTSLPCNHARLRQEHGPHDWESQPGMNPVHCPGHGQPEVTADWHAAGCARDCSEQHTYTWGRCALAPESARPEPTISIGRVETEADGQSGIVLRSIPFPAWEALITVAKWVSRGKAMSLDADPDIAPAYPDAAARRALGALHDAGLLDPTEPHITALQAVARAEGTDTATWTAVRAIQLMNEAGRRRDEAEAALARVRKLIDDDPSGIFSDDEILGALGQQPAPEPCDGRPCTGTGCSHELAAAALAIHDHDAGLYTAPTPAATQATDSPSCSCGGRFPLAHLHADQHQPEEQP